MIFPPEKRFKILLIELEALQARFAKYDDLVWRSRSWVIALVAAFLGWAQLKDSRFLENQDLLFLVTAIIPVMFWLQEGLLRLLYVQKYIARYRQLRTTLTAENASIDDLPLYDLTNHIQGRPKLTDGIKSAFFRPDQLFFYIPLIILPIALWLIARGQTCN